MQIPSIRNFVTSQVNYFLQSSWRGKVVGILCAVSFFYLIRCVAFRNKTPPKEPDNSPQSLKGRADTKAPALPRKEELDFRKQADFGAWLSKQINSYEGWLALAKGDREQQASCRLALRGVVPQLIAQVEKMIRVFKAHPDIKTDDWNAFLKECRRISDRRSDAKAKCAKLKVCLDKLQAWNNALQSASKESIKQT
jgi:hypothetical protein